MPSGHPPNYLPLRAGTPLLAAALLAGCLASHDKHEAHGDPVGAPEDASDYGPDAGGWWAEPDDAGADVPSGDVSDAGEPDAATWSPGPTDGICHSDFLGAPLAAPGRGGETYSVRPTQVSWQPSVPPAIAVGDVTGEGRADVVSVEWKDVYVLAQGASGELAEPVKLSIDEPFLYAVQLMDVDADNLLDIIVAGDSGVGTFRSLGSSQFGAYEPVSDLVLKALRAVRDMDDDGLLDLVGETEDQLVVFHGLMNGGLAAPESTPIVAATTGQWVRQRCFGDVTGDHVDDLITVLNGSDAPVVVQPGDAMSHSFALPGAQYQVGVGQNVSCAVADFNTDGLPDLAISEDDFGYMDRAWVLEQTAAGTLLPPRVVSTYGWSGPVAGGDLNRDGRDDLVRVHSLELSVALQQSNGELGTPVHYPYPDASSEDQWTLLLRDVSCDGCPDIVAANVSGIVVFYGQGCAK